MPNIDSMKKDLRRNEKRRIRNQAAKSALKTFVKKARTGGDAPTVVAAVKALDKAAQRGIIHKNQAARRKSRLMKAVNKATA